MRVETEGKSEVEIIMSENIQSPEAMAAGNLPADQLRLRDRFVEQYVIDYDAKAATMRCGYPGDFARDIAVKFMNCPYVTLKIQQYEDGKDVEKDLDQEQRRLIAQLRKEAAYYGPGSSHAARVSALSKLASIRKLDAPIKHDLTMTNKGGVMVVPGIVSLEDWQKAAEQSQEDLMKHA